MLFCKTLHSSLILSINDAPFFFYILLKEQLTIHCTNGAISDTQTLTWAFVVFSVQFTLYRNFTYIPLIIYLNAICHTLLIHSLWLTMTVVVTWLRVHLNS